MSKERCNKVGDETYTRLSLDEQLDNLENSLSAAFISYECFALFIFRTEL